jgi:hypothetical protein
MPSATRTSPSQASMARPTATSLFNGAFMATCNLHFVIDPSSFEEFEAYRNICSR